MSIDRETNRVPAFVSFRGRAMPSRIASGVLASNVTASNVMASNFAAWNITTPDMILSVALRDTRVSCESNRDLYPPSNPPSSWPNTR